MKKWTSIISAVLVLGLAWNVSTVAAEKTAITSNIASYGPDHLIKADGSFWIWGSTQSVPTQVTELNDVKDAFSNGLILKQDQSVWL